MNKPTVFFSHSSRDRATLMRLRELLLKKTASSVDIFLSSDGESIPFGRNWVSRIEAALTSTRLMFVFLSPQSLSSPTWVSFESGYGYSREVQVIPVGILGVDLNHVPAPFSILQGFNVSSHEGLNNLIATINKTFGFSHDESFQQDDFKDLFSSRQDMQYSIFGEATPLLDSIEFCFVDPRETHDIREWYKRLTSSFQDRKADIQTTNGPKIEHLTTYGVSFRVSEDSNNGDTRLTIGVDPLLSASTFALLDEVLPGLKTPRLAECPLSINFIEEVQELGDRNKISARIYGTGITLSPGGGYLFEGSSFKLSHMHRNYFVVDGVSNGRGRTTLSFSNVPFPLSSARIGTLISILLERNILQLHEE